MLSFDKNSIAHSIDDEIAVAGTNSYDSIAAAIKADAWCNDVKSTAITHGIGKTAMTRSDLSVAVTAGRFGNAICDGSYSVALSVGDDSYANVKEHDSIAIGVGMNSKVKGGLWNWLVLAEWDYDGESANLIKVHSFQVDGVTYKPDTWYVVVDGKIVEL